jgi:glycosyltransferase involved in cell wall biosynthesis
MVKVALVSEHASPLATIGGVDAGGQNIHVAALARGLAAQGVEVVVHTRRDDPTLPDRASFGQGVTIDHVTAGPTAPLAKDDLFEHMGAFADELSARWSISPPDAVHSHFWMSGLASLDPARALGVPVLHSYHALGVVKRRQQGAQDTSPPCRIAVERRLAQQVDRVVAASGAEVRELVRMGGDLGRISVIPNGVDLTSFRPEGPIAPRSSDRPRVLVVSRLVRRKGIGNVITAMAEVPDAELVVAGGPPLAMLDDDPEAVRFRDLVAHLGLERRVTFLGGILPTEVPALLRSADVVASCPWYEHFGLVVLEAMACGVPVVATAVGGQAETVLDGVTGHHVPPRRPDAIAAALRRLLGDDSGRWAMGRAGVRRAGRYAWSRIATETVAVVHEVIARANGIEVVGARSA